MNKVKAIKVLKPLVDSYVDYANISMKEEDDNIVEALEMAIEALKALDVPDTNVGDMISRQAAIDAVVDEFKRSPTPAIRAKLRLEALPPAQPEQQHGRIFQEIVVGYPLYNPYPEFQGKPYFSIKYTKNGQEFIGYGTYKPEVLSEYIKKYFMPSAQPERTCVNCGRTANNGGWYADGRTRCPIEEHYALPKDGYCHLWEKRNFTDDDYLERREDE